MKISTYGAISKSESGEVAIVLDEQRRVNTDGKIALLENGKWKRLPMGGT